MSTITSNESLASLRDTIADDLNTWGDYGYDGWYSALDTAKGKDIADRIMPIIEAYLRNA